MEEYYVANNKPYINPWLSPKEMDYNDGRQSFQLTNNRHNGDMLWENRICGSGRVKDEALNKDQEMVNLGLFENDQQPNSSQPRNFLDFVALKNQSSVGLGSTSVHVLSGQDNDGNIIIQNRLSTQSQLCDILKNYAKDTLAKKPVAAGSPDSYRGNNRSPHFVMNNRSELNSPMFYKGIKQTPSLLEFADSRNKNRTREENFNNFCQGGFAVNSTPSTTGLEINWTSAGRENSSRHSASSMDISSIEDNDIEVYSPYSSLHELNLERRRDDREARVDAHSKTSSCDVSYKRREKRKSTDEMTKDSNCKRRRHNETNFDDITRVTQAPHATKPTKKSSYSRLAWDYISVGNLQTGLSLLREQVGLANAEPYRKFVCRAMLKSNIVLSTLPEFPSATQRISKRLDNEANLSVRMDASGIEQMLNIAYKYASSAKFQGAIKKFQEILVWIPLVIAGNEDDELKVKDSLKSCRAYIHAFKMELERKSISEDSLENRKRCCELAAYVADCDLLPIHQMITLRVALTLSFKLYNFKMAAGFATRLLKLKPRHDIAMLAERLLELANRNLKDEHELNYKEGKDYSVCGQLHKPIYEDEPRTLCPYCETTYVPAYKGSVCVVCNLGEIGMLASGLTVFRRKE